MEELAVADVEVGALVRKGAVLRVADSEVVESVRRLAFEVEAGDVCGDAGLACAVRNNFADRIVALRGEGRETIGTCFACQGAVNAKTGGAGEVVGELD